MLSFMTGYGFMSTVSASLPTLKSSCRDSGEKNLIRRSEARVTIGRDGEGSRPMAGNQSGTASRTAGVTSVAELELDLACPWFFLATGFVPLHFERSAVQQQEQLRKKRLIAA